MKIVIHAGGDDGFQGQLVDLLRRAIRTQNGSIEQLFDRSAMQKPSIGQTVHYVSYGTPGGEFSQQCRAAIVTEVGVPGPDGAERVGLAALNPTGIFLHSLAAGGCTYHDGCGVQGAPDCPDQATHGNPFRYCGCGWVEASPAGGTWHWPERV